MRRIDVFIPQCLPDAMLNPNRGERRGGRIPEEISKAKSALEEAVYWPLWNDYRDIEPLDPAHVILTLRWFKRERRVAAVKGQKVRPVIRAGEAYYKPDDPGNACYALKAGIDGIVRAGLIKDDSYKHVALLTTRVERCESESEEGLFISVVELGAEEDSPETSATIVDG